MKVSRYAIVSMLASVALLLSAGTARGQDDVVYRWVDDDRIVNFTQGLGSVPQRHVPRAVALGSMSGGVPPKEAPPPGEAQSPASTTPPSPTPPQPAPRSTPDRAAADEALANARTTDQFLAASRTYTGLALGLAVAAKTAIDRATMVATTSQDWDRIAKAYADIGQGEPASDARKKSEQLLQQERAIPR
jgi:hypothetical protein